MKKFFTLVFVLFYASLFSYSDEYNVIKNIYDNQNTQGTEEVKPTGDEIKDFQPYQQPKNTGIYEFNPKQVKETPKTNLGDVVVTAGTLPESIGVVPRNIDIIDEKEFKKYSSSGNMPDIFESISGINVRRYGPINALSTLSLRGGSSRQALILINNIPVTDLGTQDTDLSLLDLTGIDKIEIVKGGLSSVYGANASAGVINLISEPVEKKLISFDSFYGSNNSQKLSLRSTYNLFNLNYTISLAEEKSDGYFINSSYLKRNANARAYLQTENSLTEIDGYYAKRDNSIPFNEFGPTPDAKQYDEIYGIGFNEIYNLDFLKLKAKGYMRGGDLIYKDEMFSIDDRHIKKEKLAQLSALYEEGDFIKIIFGGELTNQELNSTKAGLNTLDNNALFSSITLFLFKNLTINASGRIDNNAIYGQEKSGSLGVKYNMPENTEIFSSLEYAFSAPTLMELFWNEKTVYDFGGGYTYTSEIYGNKNLKTEKSYSYEIGINKKEKSITETISFFRRDVIDLIKWQVDTDFLTYDKSMPVNIDRAFILGIEASVKFNPFDFIGTGANYTYMYAIDSNTREKLPYSPEDKINGYLEFVLPFKSKIGITAEYVDFRFDTKKRLMKEYYLFGGYFTHTINDYFKAYLNVNNLFDNKDYMVINMIPMPGREIMAGANFMF